MSGILRFPFLFAALVGVAFAQDGASGWVVIPVNEYGALHTKAFPVNREPEPAPVEATLSRVDYDLRVNGTLASGRANLTVDVLKEGWVRVPIPAGLLVREARLNGNLASLVPSGAGGNQLSAMLSKRGRSVLLLDVALPVVATATDERISLPGSSSGVTRASLTLPRQGIDIKVTGGLLAERTEPAGQTHCLAYGRGNEALVFGWHRKLDEHRAEQPLRMRATLTELLGLGEDSTSIYAEVKADVVQGAARQVRVQLPDKLTVNQVLGTTVADWEAKPGELAVTFLDPVEQSASFVLTAETRLPRDGPITIPILGVPDAERLSGGVAVEVIGAGEVTNIRPQGLEKADASELGPVVAGRESPSLTAFRFLPGADKTAKSLNVQVARYEQQAVLTANVEEARYRVLMTREGKTLVEARYAVRNNQRNFLKVTLPTGAVVWSASVGDRPVRPGQTPDGSLLLPLPKAREGEEAPASVVELIYFSPGARWEDKSRAALALPALDLPVSHTGLTLFYPPLFRVTAEPGAFRVQPFEAPSSPVLNNAVAAPRNAAVTQQAALTDVFQQFNRNAAQSGTQALVDKFRARSEARKPSGSLPIRVPFPEAGPSLYLTSELTGEDQRPTVALTYQSERKRGGK